MFAASFKMFIRVEFNFSISVSTGFKFSTWGAHGKLNQNLKATTYIQFSETLKISSFCQMDELRKPK